MWTVIGIVVVVVLLGLFVLISPAPPRTQSAAR